MSRAQRCCLNKSVADTGSVAYTMQFCIEWHERPPDAPDSVVVKVGLWQIHRASETQETQLPTGDIFRATFAARQIDEFVERMERTYIPTMHTLECRAYQLLRYF